MLRTHALLFCVFTIAAPSQAAITWNLTYNDIVNSTGVGFNDGTFGATRRNTFGAVLDYINTVVDANGTADLTINNSQTDGTGSLASAGTRYFTGPNGFSNGILFSHATTGVDPLPMNTDGIATFDFGYNWNSELDATAAGEFDLFTVILHEVTHAMGFASLLNPDGTSAISDGNPGVFSVLDSFLERGDGTDLFSAGGNYEGDAADLISEDVFFNGANAVAANGGAPVRIFAPDSFQEGSSLSHVDLATFPNAVMTPAIAPGIQKREYSEIDRAILADIGWNVTAVPEPSASFLLVLLGSTILLRRRK